MALFRRKVQMEMAKKPAKRKATIRREAALFSITNPLAMAQALQAPLYECWERKGIFEPMSASGPLWLRGKRRTTGYGKSMYLADHNDNAQFSRKVVNTLMTKLGRNGFHSLMPIKGPEQIPD